MNYDDIFECLEKIKFPNNTYRPIASNYGSCKTMTFGLTGLGTRTFESVKGERYPETYEKLKMLATKLNKDHKYTSITVNKNFKTFPHYDNNNVGMSMIISIGNFTGGRLILNNKSGDEFIDIHNKPYFFNGSEQLHSTEEFQGTRYSIIYFTRTF